MAGPWLYSISKRPGYHFEVGRKKIPVTIDSYRELIQSGRLGLDRKWHIAQHFIDVQAGDDVFVYSGDRDFGVLGYATVSRVRRDERALDLQFDRNKCMALLERPVPAATVRSWKLNTRRNVVDLGDVAERLYRLLPWRIHREADDVERASARAGTADAFSPTDLRDARKRIHSSIVQRQGQTVFRARLLEAYGERCAITNCGVAHVLEAAHIVPYLGPKTNHIGNGLLLRADVHTLFDLRLIAITIPGHRLVISKTLTSSAYRSLAGTKLRLPRDPMQHPSSLALKRAWEEFQMREAER